MSDSERGYLSPDSKRRFTLAAGILGALFFLAQIVFPMIVMFLFMFPAMFAGNAIKVLDVDGAALTGVDLWAVERTTKFDFRNAGNPANTLSLARLQLADLSDAGASVPLEDIGTDTTPELLVAGDRVWVLGSEEIAYYERGAVKYLSNKTRPQRASRPFMYAGRPTVITLGATPALAVLRDEIETKWELRDIALGRPGGVGTLKSVQAVEAGNSLYIVGELCSEDRDRCSLSYRDLEHSAWLPLADDVCSCATWTAVSIAMRPAVFVSEPERNGGAHLSLVTVGADGPRRKSIEVAGTRMWSHWRPLASGSRLVLVSSDGMPGSLHLAEVENGRVTRTAKRPGAFPFPANMMAVMLIPQLLPIGLSLVLALLLTIQMRRHRVPDYELGAERRAFATLWQRAVAQLVDLVPFVAGFAVPMRWMWRMFSDPESLIGDGTTFPWVMVASVFGAFLWAIVVFVAYSYYEGRSGKTPGKWLMGIRVLGADLRPCGFGRAFLRNLLTFVDGFFSFLVGALLVALTENWQRLGDMAARTIVVADERS